MKEANSTVVSKINHIYKLKLEEISSSKNNTAASLNMAFLLVVAVSITNDNTIFIWMDNLDYDNCKVGQVRKGGNNLWDNRQVNLNS